MNPAEPTLAVVGRLGRAQLHQITRRAARRMGRSRPEALPLSTVPVPDTPVGLEAAGLLAGHAPVTLAAHSHRAYLFGALLGRRDALTWDPEALFVAAMLHDLGLTEFVSGTSPFEQRGAAWAQSWLEGQGWPEERAALVARAIRMHLDVGLADKDRPEVALLHFGTAADVTGLRLEDIHPSTVEEVLAAYPRQGFAAFFAGKMRAEAQAQPHSATATLCRWGQFTWRIKHSPFTE